MSAAPTPTPTPMEFDNASMGLTDSFASAYGLAEVLAVVLVAAGVLFTVVYASSSLERYERVWALVSGVRRVLILAAWGLVGVAVLAVAAAPAWYVASQPAATRGEWLSYAGYGLAALLGLAAFGWVVERIGHRIIDRHEEYVERHGEESDDAPAPEPATDGGQP